MKDKIEQLYISAIQGEWDSAYFAERMMELVQVTVEAKNTNNTVAYWTSTDTLNSKKW